MFELTYKAIFFDSFLGDAFGNNHDTLLDKMAQANLCWGLRVSSSNFHDDCILQDGRDFGDSVEFKVKN